MLEKGKEMKKLVVEEDGEGLMKLLGEEVLLICSNYFYAGILVGVNEHDVLLEKASLVYETGKWTDKKWKDAQDLGHPLYVRTASIESYMKGK